MALYKRNPNVQTSIKVITGKKGRLVFRLFFVIQPVGQSRAYREQNYTQADKHPICLFVLERKWFVYGMKKAVGKLDIVMQAVREVFVDTGNFCQVLIVLENPGLQTMHDVLTIKINGRNRYYKHPKDYQNYH